MDIEGAEYDIIADMLSDATFRMIDELYIEFHMQNQYNVNEYMKMISQQNPNTIIDTTWDAMHSPYLKNQSCEEYYYKISKSKVENRFRPPLSKEEKIEAIYVFANKNFPITIDDKKKINLENHRDFLNFRNALDKYNKTEEWKKFVMSIATMELKL